MLPRAGKISLLLFQFVWLNMIVPGHTRGAITVPSGEGSSCCAKHDQAPGKSDSSKPAKDPSHCAICFFAARLTLPEAVDLTPPPLELLAISSPPTVESICFNVAALPFDGRAPPLA